MNNKNRQIIEKALKLRDEEIKSFISKQDDQNKDDEKYAEIVYFVETNIDVMKYNIIHQFNSVNNSCDMIEYITINLYYRY